MAYAEKIPACSVPTGVDEYKSLEVLPDPVKLKLGNIADDIVPAEAPFDATDRVHTHHSRRLIFVWHRADRWIVATEHGGLAYNDPVFAFSVSQDGRTASLLEDHIAFPQTVCNMAERMLNEGLQAIPLQSTRIPQFENDAVNAWRSTILPNQPLSLHRHDHPRILVALTEGTLNFIDSTGAKQALTLHTGSAYYLPAMPPGAMHSDVNPGTQPIQVMVIELKHEH